uniref:Haloacid dehalogenase-like hydrolase domain-containing 5 n=1 Tax=Caenorhabditis tropicalis TaxID=1561998 RepID=A0A1I7T453_9PELO
MNNIHRFIQKRSYLRTRHAHPFGIVLDIDGVLFKGRNLLPRVKEAFSLITDKKGNFVVPTVFLTNGTNSTEKIKAAQLSEQLGFRIPADHVLMSHSPLRMFTNLHDKQVLVVGQKNARAIAKGVGFKKVTTIDHLGKWFPHLDCTDFSRKLVDPKETEAARKRFRPIEAIVMLGEPLKWETSLQLMLDCVLTYGKMDTMVFPIVTGGRRPDHIPIVACNVDLVWMADIASQLPRIGHGAFIHILDTLYEKLTHQHLQFTATLGKPTEVSYLHAAHRIQRLARSMNLGDVKYLYVIGDNPMSDVLGARLFDRYLRHGGVGRFDHLDLEAFEGNDGEKPRVRTRNVVERCISILVETGVHQENVNMNGVVKSISALIDNLSMGEQMLLNQPNFVEYDLHAAIRTILRRECYR